MANRKDIHSPANIDPAAYAYEGKFVIYPGGSEASEFFAECIAEAIEGEFGSAPYYFDVEDVLAKKKEAGGFDGNFSSKSTCDHCGARFNYGALFKHEPSGEYVAVGHICAVKTFGKESKRDLHYSKAVRAIKLARERAEGLDYLHAIGLGSVLDKDHAKRHYILNDLRNKAIKWKGLSEKQIALAHKIANEIDKPDVCDFCKAEGHDEKHCPEVGPVPAAGRHKDLEGVVIGTRIDDGYVAGTSAYKWLVRLDNGSKLWGTVPSGIFDEVDSLKDLKGLRVSFSATIKPKEKSFGIASRPSCPKVLLDAETEAAYKAAAERALKIPDAVAALSEAADSRSDAIYTKADRIGGLTYAAGRFLDEPEVNLPPNALRKKVAYTAAVLYWSAYEWAKAESA